MTDQLNPQTSTSALPPDHLESMEREMRRLQEETEASTRASDKPKRKQKKKSRKRRVVPKIVVAATQARPLRLAAINYQRALMYGAAAGLSVLAYFSMALTMSIGDHPVVASTHVRDQSRLPQDAPLVPTAVKTERFTAPTNNEQKRSDIQAAFQLASADPSSLETAPKQWPRVLPETEEAARKDAVDQLRSIDAWASATPADIYLAQVYARTSQRKDRGGDFSWKDPAAAKKKGMNLYEYVIGGIHPDLRELVYTLGQKLDAEGLGWTITSGFRDDYRQSIAAGLKARTGYSRHGGSRATRGYGDGQAVDVTALPGTTLRTLFAAIDRVGRPLGLHRPMPGYDPFHIQPNGQWRVIAARLKSGRTGEPVTAVAAVAEHRGRQVRHARAHVRHGMRGRHHARRARASA